jgi:hypothetical protein
MTSDDVLAELRELETRLRSARVQAAYRERPETERRRLAAARTELSLLLERLTTARIESVAAGLHELDGELKAATAAVRSRIEKVDRPAAALNAVARLLGVLARLVVLAG